MASNTYNVGWSDSAGNIGAIIGNSNSDKYFALPISTLNTVISNANLGRVNITGISLSFTVWVECSQSITPKYSVGYSHATGSISTALISDRSVYSNGRDGEKNDSVSLNAALYNNSISNSYGSYIVFRVYSTEWGKKSYSVENVKLTITYEVIPQYTITLYAGTGVSSVSGGGTYYRGDTATISATLAPGYYLEGNDTCFWSPTNEDFANFVFETKTVSFTVDKNLTLYAWMYPNVYNIKYGRTANGTWTDWENIDYGANYTIKACMFTGNERYLDLKDGTETLRLASNQVFSHWYCEELNTSYSPGQVVKNLTTEHMKGFLLVAQWTQPVFTIPAPAPKEGYDFLGWRYNSSTVYQPGDSLKFDRDATVSVSLTAEWKKQKIEDVYGGNNKAGVYVANTECKAVYVGNTQVYG